MSVIVSPITNHANRTTSHRTGWGRMWSKCLGADLAFREPWNDDNIAYFEHGMEFNPKSKGVNVFLKEPKSWDNLAGKALQIQEYSGELFSLDIDCPDYGARLRSRVRDHSTIAYKQLDFNKISDVCAAAKTVRQRDLEHDGLVLGDSHALAAWREDAHLCRIDGQTLNGALSRHFASWIDEFTGSRLKFLRTYFGNIDIRHHICRLASTSTDQRALAIDLVDRYVQELLHCQELYEIEMIEVVESLPIENESRKLPKTGYYKGQPFWGSWKERDDVHRIFDEQLREKCQLYGLKTIPWPDYFLNCNEELAFSVMEKPRSVHVSPEHYMWSI